jgi:chromatin structure-remodeling complex subunit RSC1/2
VQELSYNGEIWKVGDWVYVPNVSDAAKALVAQVNRMWQDVEGQRWIRVLCHHTEQVVSDIMDGTYDSEVLNMGQCQDYKIEQVLDRCVVRIFAGDLRERSVDDGLYSSSD